MLIIFIIFLKFAIPVLTVFMPFAGGWLNFVLDTIDGDLLIPLGLDDKPYQLIDKSADLITYIAMAIAAYWGKWSIRKVIYWLFGLRIIGQIVFFVTQDERVFFLFPNFLEPLFLVYASMLLYHRLKSKNRKMWRQKTADAFYRHRILIYTVVFIYKMQDEFITHISNTDRSELIKRLF